VPHYVIIAWGGFICGSGFCSCLDFSFTLKINLIKTKYKVLQIAQGKENRRSGGVGSNKQRSGFRAVWYEAESFLSTEKTSIEKKGCTANFIPCRKLNIRSLKNHFKAV
jgi:hypothetical protein